MPKRRSYKTGSIYQRGQYWHIQYFLNGKRQREPTGSTVKQDAINLLRKRLGEIAGGKFRGLTPERVTVADLVELVLEDYRYRELRTTSDVVWRSNKHILPIAGTWKAGRYGAAQTKQYVAARWKQGAENSTINRELSIIRRGFKLAARKEPPLVMNAPFIAKLDERNVRKGFVEPEQYEALLAAMPEHLKAIFVVGFHVGNRAGELRQITWPQIDLDARELSLSEDQTKGKRARTLPIYGEMIPWLERQKEERDLYFPDCPWVFHWNGKPIGSHMKGWSKACSKAGMPGLYFHDLRRSAIRNMVRSGIPEKVAMDFSGHKTRAVFSRYDIVSKSDLDLAAEKMTKYLKDKRAPKKKSPGSEGGTVIPIKDAK